MRPAPDGRDAELHGGVRPAAHVIHQQLRPKGRNPEAGCGEERNLRPGPYMDLLAPPFRRLFQRHLLRRLLERTRRRRRVRPADHARHLGRLHRLERTTGHTLSGRGRIRTDQDTHAGRHHRNRRQADALLHRKRQRRRFEQTDKGDAVRHHERRRPDMVRAGQSLDPRIPMPPAADALQRPYHPHGQHAGLLHGRSLRHRQMEPLPHGGSQISGRGRNLRAGTPFALRRRTIRTQRRSGFLSAPQYGQNL